MWFSFFKDPVEADSWSGILDATEEKPMCIQKNLFLYETYDKLLGAEDCLYINVYTPKVIGLIWKKNILKILLCVKSILCDFVLLL